jgi:hypothetical protein
MIKRIYADVAQGQRSNHEDLQIDLDDKPSDFARICVCRVQQSRGHSQSLTRSRRQAKIPDTTGIYLCSECSIEFDHDIDLRYVATTCQNFEAADTNQRSAFTCVLFDIILARNVELHSHGAKTLRTTKKRSTQPFGCIRALSRLASTPTRVSNADRTWLAMNAYVARLHSETSALHF